MRHVHLGNDRLVELYVGCFTELTPPDWYSEHMVLRGASPIVVPWNATPLKESANDLLRSSILETHAFNYTKFTTLHSHLNFCNKPGH